MRFFVIFRELHQLERDRTSAMTQRLIATLLTWRYAVPRMAWFGFPIKESIEQIAWAKILPVAALCSVSSCQGPNTSSDVLRDVSENQQSCFFVCI